MTKHINRNCLSYWFQKLVAAGIPVPRTEIVRTDVRLEQLLEGKTPDGWMRFLSELYDAVARIMGVDNASWLPVFLRTGQGSGKHNWDKCCYFDMRKSSLDSHVRSLVEWSHMVDFLGLPTDVWCVREMLPVEPIAVLQRYGNMPLVSEYRGFVKGGKLVCVHPYWPEGAVSNGLEEVDRSSARALFHKAARTTIDDATKVIDLINRVAVAFADDGAWSVDVLETDRGWYVTDMAEAHRSFHWEGCQNDTALSKMAGV